MFENLKNQIIIISSPRTGSTSLLQDIHEHFLNKGIDMEIHNEPESFGLVMKHITENKNFILKVHALDIVRKYPQFLKYKIENGDFSVVKIERRNFVNQCVSNYISRITNVWGSTKEHNRTLEEAEIPMIESEIQNNISILNRYNEELNKITKYDLSFIYEDYEFLSDKTVTNAKVKNYEQIRNEFLKHLS